MSLADKRQKEQFSMRLIALAYRTSVRFRTVMNTLCCAVARDAVGRCPRLLAARLTITRVDQAGAAVGSIVGGRLTG
jgi:hypothetical protein